MKCPFCDADEDKVIDSRSAQDGAVIRRRRECIRCDRRFTTYERIEEMMPLVVKKDGRREAFDRTKVTNGLTKACEKRPVSQDSIEEQTTLIEQKLLEAGQKEVASSMIGEAIMQALHGLDQVAYVRFASVYRSFEDVGEFMSELEELIQERRRGAKRRKPKASG